jgi:Amt family ammonium transporter
MLSVTVFVLFMTIPRLALFYAGPEHTKNVLSVRMQCFAITRMVFIAWVLLAYGLAFGEGSA